MSTFDAPRGAPYSDERVAWFGECVAEHGWPEGHGNDLQTYATFVSRSAEGQTVAAHAESETRIEYSGQGRMINKYPGHWGWPEGDDPLGAERALWVRRMVIEHENRAAVEARRQASRMHEQRLREGNDVLRASNHESQVTTDVILDSYYAEIAAKAMRGRRLHVAALAAGI
jgi:hypothetical protein